MAKVILIGEHSVLYGKKAIAIPIKKNIYINIKKSNKPYKCNDKNIESLVYTVSKYFSKLPYLKIHIKNQVPISKGMGSSATLAVEMVKAIARYYRKNIEKEKIYLFSKEYEDKIHKPSSGLDILTCLSDKWVILNKNFDNTFNIVEKKYFLNLNLVIIDTNTKGMTKEAVKKVRENKNRDSIIEEISNETNKFLSILDNNEIEYSKIANIFNNTHKLLCKLGLNNKKIDDIVNFTLKNKAIASKISGSGLGGIIISLVKNEDLQDFKKNLEIEKIKILGIEKI